MFTYRINYRSESKSNYKSESKFNYRSESKSNCKSICVLSMFSYIKMETSSAVIIFIFLIGICYMIYDSIPSKYTKLEPSKYPPKLWWIYE